MTNGIEWIAGRYLLAALFGAGAIQKAVDSSPAQALLAGFGLSEWLVWPALAFNAVTAGLLIAGKFLRPVGLALALYCVVTSIFHFVPSDPWQMSIMIKNWAIAGGCLILAASSNKET
ncbi:MAG: DoxX family membrane protein [Pseudomonas balearica]|nr:DoxX family membrane protein [Stutzerimonas balearica]